MTGHHALLLLHLLGAGVVFSVVFFSLTLSLDKPLTTEKIRAISYLRPFGKYAVGLQVITGLLLVYPDWSVRSQSPLFWTKMILIVVDGILAELIIRRKLELISREDGEIINTDLKLWALISFLVIFTVVVIGFLSTTVGLD